MKVNKAIVYYYSHNIYVDASEYLNDLIDNDRYLSGKVFDIESIEIGEFEDDMAINYRSCTKEECEEFYEAYKAKNIQSKPEPCYHLKVYENCILTSNPPQQRWICSKCGEKGIDTIGSIFSSDNSYERLIGKFKGK